jgi:hypothetical protein
MARGGGADRFFMAPDSDPDWMDIHAKVTLTELPFSAYKTWMEEDLKKGSWLVFMIHGLEKTKAWQPITRKVFTAILDYLQERDFWVDTFLHVGAYFQAGKIFEKSRMEPAGAGKRWSWKIPDHFPRKLVLKVRLEGGGGWEASQAGTPLVPDADGFYSVLFNKGELTLRPSSEI